MADLSKLKKAELLELVAELEARLGTVADETPSVAVEIRRMVAGRTLCAEDQARLAVALHLADILDGGSVHLASAGIAKQVLAIIADLATEEEQAENPLAKVMLLERKSG